LILIILLVKAEKNLDSELPKLSSIMSGIYNTNFTLKMKKSLLIVLQGMDTSGKDGIIKTCDTAFNPASCRVESFKVPTSEELAHDFLWRAHKVVPRKRVCSGL
jgi:polyphosphate kinase 2 (PPK2 family)